MTVGTMLEKKVVSARWSGIEMKGTLKTFQLGPRNKEEFSGKEERRVRSAFHVDDITFTFICSLGKEQII